MCFLLYFIKENFFFYIKLDLEINMMKKRKNILGIVFLLLSTFSFAQQIDNDSLILLSKIQFCKDYGIGHHGKVIVNGKDACEIKVEEGDTFIFSKNITLGVFDSIEIFLVGPSRSSNLTQPRFIILNRYNGNRIENIQVNDLNNFSKGTSSLSVVDKSYIFLFSHYTSLIQYFFTTSKESYIKNLQTKQLNGNLFNLEKYKVVKFKKKYKVYVLTKKNRPVRTKNKYEKHMFVFNENEELIDYRMKVIDLDDKTLNKKW